MLVGVNCGHTKNGPGSGAVGKISESEETRKVGYELMKKLKERGIGVVDCTVDKAATQAQYLEKAIEIANSHSLNYFISIHFNAGGGKGVEVFTYGGKRLEEAVKVCENISSLGFVNRGIKDGSNLFVVRKSRAKAMLIEVCFVDSKDPELYLKLGVDKIADSIADAICKDLDNSNNNDSNNNLGNTGSNNKEEYDMKKIVLYGGDIDSLAAIIVAQKYKCPMMKESDFKESGLKAEEIIKIGGKEDSNRYETFKEAAKLV